MQNDEIIFQGIKKMLPNLEPGFTVDYFFNSKEFGQIQEDDRMYLIKHYLNQLESIGVVDKIGRHYYYNA